MTPRLLVFLLCLTAAAAEAQIRLDPRAEAPSLDSALEIVPDATLSLDALLADSAAFVPVTSMYPGGDTPEAYWGRVRLRSVAETPTQWILPLSFDEVTAVLVHADGRRDVHRTGHRLPLAERTLPLAHPPAARIGLAPGETATLYLRVRQAADSYVMELDPRPIEADAFATVQRGRDVLQALFLGILLALAFYNLFLFTTFRDRSYLYYVLFLVASAVYWAALQGYILQYLWPAGRPGYPELDFFALSLAATSYTLFVRSFLHTREVVPRLDRVLVGVALGWVASGGLAALGFWSLAPTLGALLALVLLTTTFASGVLAHRAGFRPARYYLLAAGAFLAIGLVYAVLYFADPSLQNHGRSILQVAMLLEVLLLAVALTVRIRILDEEKAEAIAARGRAEATSDAFREAGELKTHLLGIAAHDLRSPLTGIIGFAEVIEEEAPHRLDLHEYTAVIRRGAQRMLSLVEDLLVTAALDGSRLELRREILDVGALVADVAADYRPRAADKGQTLDVSLPSRMPLASIDSERFRAIVDNLVSNAIKFTPPGGRIEVVCARGRDDVRITVSDSGPGLSVQDQQSLFERFRRLTPAPTGDEPSSGLGLSIAQELAHLHGGQIEVESALGEGTAFTLVLPLAKGSAPASADRSPEAAQMA